MPPASTYDCGHERRPGTTVCLQCRQQAIASSARKQRRLLLAVAAFMAVVMVLAGVLMAGRGVVERRTGGQTVLAGSSDAPALAAELAAAAEPTPANRTPLLEPRVQPGRTDLGEGMYAVRSGDTVLVNFDTPDARTRRRDKFDRTLRTTLRRVYGAPIDTMLAGQTGNLLGPRDLITEVVPSGLRLALPENRGTLEVRPGTRPGQDGPLVVSYTVIVTR